MKTFGRLAGTALFLTAVSALAGCGDSSMAQVSGSVTVDGQPIDKGAIAFYPVDGKAPTAGGEIKAGAYSVRVPVGLMKVEISMPKEVGKKKLYNTPNSPEHPIYSEALPPRYNKNTELKLDVMSGKTEKNWALTTKEK